MDNLLRIVVTGACSDIGSQLCLRIARGDVFGREVAMELVLVDNHMRMGLLQNGVAVELGMCNLPLMRKTTCTCNLEEAFTNADAIFLVGGVGHVTGYSRTDVICINAIEYKEVGLALAKIDAKKTLKILVVAEPPTILMCVISHFAPGLNPYSITGLSRAHQNRASTCLAKKLEVPAHKVFNLTVWGNCSPSLFLDVRHAKVEICGKIDDGRNAVKNDFFLKYKFIEMMRTRVLDIQQRLKSPPCMSVVSAAVQHMREWLQGSRPDTMTSMVVLSDGSYEIEKGLPFSLPVRILPSGKWEVQQLDINFFERETLDNAVKEIQEERLMAFSVIGHSDTARSEEIAPPPWSFGAKEKIPCSILRPLEEDRISSVKRTT